MTRRNLFQVVTAAVGALLFPKTAAITFESVEAAPATAETTAKLGLGVISDSGWDFYLKMAWELGEAVERTKEMEILGVLDMPVEPFRSRRLTMGAE